VKIIYSTVLVSSLIFAGGCANHVVSDPGKITLEEAMESLGRGFVRLKKAQREENGGSPFKTGLLPSEAEVTFNISASAEDTSKLYVEVTKTPLNRSKTSGGEIGSTHTSSRGNQVTVKFRNIAFSKTTKNAKAGTVTIEGVTDPEVLKKVVEALNDSGITVYAQ